MTFSKIFLKNPPLYILEGEVKGLKKKATKHVDGHRESLHQSTEFKLNEIFIQDSSGTYTSYVPDIGEGDTLLIAYEKIEEKHSMLAYHNITRDCYSDSYRTVSKILSTLALVSGILVYLFSIMAFIFGLIDFFSGVLTVQYFLAGVVVFYIGKAIFASGLSAWKHCIQTEKAGKLVRITQPGSMPVN
ncbi:hypothetical protein MNBD_GAMMA10-470 [hydrothermal vent metagenome]|uniref:Uncharacterized protein n=1 Tax=hydrothermal vent metagenome TaxID=652676 RepID=A0A3B0XZZ9_9ZZZZ